MKNVGLIISSMLFFVIGFSAGRAWPRHQIPVNYKEFASAAPRIQSESHQKAPLVGMRSKAEPAHSDPETLPAWLRGDGPVIFPKAMTASWVTACRKVDHHYGMLYRICALVPAEQKKVRDLLAREQLISDARGELLARGVPQAEIELRLRTEIDLLQSQQEVLDKSLPEVSELLAEFKAHPDAVTTTREIVDRIEVDSGPVDPAQAEDIFIEMRKSEASNPVPSFVVDLSLDKQTPSALLSAEHSLDLRNRQLIPEIDKRLSPSQMVGFMSYIDEQMTAIQNAHK